jgi:hypothetical protein
VAAAAILAAALLTGCQRQHHAAGPGSSTASGGSDPANPSDASPTPTPSWPPAVDAHTGPYGAQAGWVSAENGKPGTSAWHLQNHRGPDIAGYANTTAATVGDQVHLQVDTAAKHFHVEAYRLGYYGGAQARLVWRSNEIAGVKQQTCPRTPGINRVECHWPTTTTIPITAQWPPGAYLLKLVADPGRQKYVPLTVWDPSSQAAYVIDSSVFTWQAWNTYGGYSMYGGGPPGVDPTYEDRARVMSYDRPYTNGDGAGELIFNELPLISFMEQRGLDVTYWTDVTFHEHPQLIRNHRAYLSLGHAECWSNAERAAAVDGIKHGVNFVFFAASPILRHVRVQPDRFGVADREMVDYRDPDADPIIHKHPKEATGNTWEQPPAAAPSSEITGNTYGGYNIDFPLVIADAKAWPFAHTGLHNGDALPHVVQFDFDGYNPDEPNPPAVQIMAHSPVSGDSVMSWASYADLTYYTDRHSHAGVLATGTNDWINALNPCPSGRHERCPTRYIRAITGNVLRVFGAGPAGLTHPSVGNTGRFPQ